MGAVFHIRDAHWQPRMTERNGSRDGVLNITYNPSIHYCVHTVPYSLGSMGHGPCQAGLDGWDVICNLIYVHTIKYCTYIVTYLEYS